MGSQTVSASIRRDASGLAGKPSTVGDHGRPTQVMSVDGKGLESSGLRLTGKELTWKSTSPKLTLSRLVVLEASTPKYAD